MVVDTNNVLGIDGTLSMGYHGRGLLEILMVMSMGSAILFVFYTGLKRIDARNTVSL